jgi:hypothetical protein
MPRQCTICAHSARQAVERDLLASVPVTRVAEEYGLAPSSIRRHRARHLAPRLTRALARQEDVNADNLAAMLVGLQEKTLLGLAKAEQAKDFPAMRGFIREARENVLATARIVGILDAAPTTIIDARKQQAIFASLSEEELRALARAAADGDRPALEVGAGSAE